MVQLFFKIILTMLYMGYTTLAWNPYTTPQIVKDQLSVEFIKLTMFVGFCWVLTTIIIFIVKMAKKTK